MDGITDLPAGNLPAELPSLVGRDTERPEIGALLRKSQLVTLTGVAGVGKTRTALSVGADVRDLFPDGVWLIPLSQLRQGGLVAHAVALELKVRDQTARPMIDLLIEHLADRRCLLVLDTCEHLVDECGLLVSALAYAAPGAQVLATSREPLGVEGEIVVELAPLPAPPAELDGKVDELVEYDSVALFTARARESDPGFAVTEANAAAVARLCRRLDGLPLALELAAAQVREHPVEELADRPNAHAALPYRPGSTPLAPHGSLWTTIGWSHELCTPAERLLWARASVFAGAFALDAAEEVCAGGPLDGVPEVLESLVARSVVVRQGERFRMLDSLREYGASWLRELGEQHAIQVRHRDRYLSLARRAFPEWTGAGQVAWYRSLARDYPEVRLAMETSLAEPGSTATELAGALWFLWFSCEYEREGRDFLERALAHDPAPGPLRVRAAWALGLVMIFQGDMKGIERCVRECRSAAPDLAATRAADYIEATDRSMGGRPDLALERLGQLAAGPWERGIQEAVWLMARASLVFARLVMGDHAAAGELAEDIRLDGSRRGEQKFRCWGHYIHALIALSAGDHRAAARHAREGFHGFEQLDDSSNMALCLEALAIATGARGDPERAAVLLGISVRLWHPAGGRARFTAPELAAARDACEQRIAAAIGRDALEAGFRTGFHSMPPYLGAPTEPYPG